MQILLPNYLYVGLAIFSCINAQFPQKCYYAPNKQAGSAIIPCGDPTSGVQSCCQNGDFCMSDSVCFNPMMGVTYQYGCTDSSYTDQISCPQKCGLDVGKYFERLKAAKKADGGCTEESNWVGLIYCNGSSNQWDCNHPETCGKYCPTNSVWQQAIQSLPSRPRGCDDLTPQKGAFAGPTSLAPVLLLPTNLGGVTSYYSLSAIGGSYITLTATSPFTMTATATNATPTSSSTNTGSFGQTASATSLSTGAKAGIGAGVGTVVLIIAALTAFLLMKRRRRRSKHEQSEAVAPGSTFGEQTLDENYRSTKAELASDAQTQHFSIRTRQELPTNHSGQDLSSLGQGRAASTTPGLGSDSSGVHELPDTNWAGNTHYDL